jgi:DNA polymerase III alpha subunit
MNVSLKGIQKDIDHLTGKEVSVKCVVIKFVHWESKKGRRFGKLVVKDKRKTFNFWFFGDVYNTYENASLDKRFVRIKGMVKKNDFSNVSVFNLHAIEIIK